jgi:uncharacterized protein
MHYDTVFHFDNDPVSLRISINNILNFYKAVENESFSVVLLVNGPGIKLMGRDNVDFAGDIQTLKGLGVSIRVCQNAMNAFNLNKDWLCPECEIVPAGVVELIDLQRKGFAYIKP